MMRSSRIEGPGDRQHRLGEVYQRETESAGQVTGKVPATATQLEHGLRPAVGCQQVGGEDGLLRVLLRRRDERPPRREIAVEPELAPAREVIGRVGHRGAASGSVHALVRRSASPRTYSA